MIYLFTGKKNKNKNHWASIKKARILEKEKGR